MYPWCLTTPKDSGARVPAGFVESVLISTDKPALILPFVGEFQTAGSDVLIGWNATPQAARAVTAAMPWLRSARRVHVLEAVDELANSCWAVRHAACCRP